MRKIVLSILLGLALSLTLVAVAFAEEYIVNVTVDGKPVTLSVVVDGTTVTVNPHSPGAKVVSVTKVEAAVTQPAATTATANRNANLRSGPGTNYPVAGGVKTGQALTITGRNQAGDWLQLADGKWIAAFLVNNAPVGLAIVGASVAQPLQPVAQPTPAPQPTATPAPPTAAGPECDPSYPGICIPPNSPDLDCGEIGYRRFQVLPPDPHRFDGDHDGIGCES